MAFTILTKARVIKALKECVILVGSDPITNVICGFIAQGMPWGAALPPTTPYVQFYNLTNPSESILTLVEQYAGRAVRDTYLRFPSRIYANAADPRLQDVAFAERHLEGLFSNLKVDCTPAASASVANDVIMFHEKSTNKLVLNTKALAHRSAIVAVYPLSLLHELTHVIEDCLPEKAKQRFLNLKHRGVELTADEFQIGGHCVRFRNILLELTYKAQLVRTDLYKMISASFFDDMLNMDFDQYKGVDPYAWETPIYKEATDSFLANKGHASVPSVGIAQIQYPSSLDEAVARFKARPNLSTDLWAESATDTDISFKGFIISVDKETNLLKKADSRYALHLLGEAYIAPIPAKKSVFSAVGPSLIAAFDSEIKTLRFFYTDGNEPFFEITSTEAFWVLDAFR